MMSPIQFVISQEINTVAVSTHQNPSTEALGLGLNWGDFKYFSSVFCLFPYYTYTVHILLNNKDARQDHTIAKIRKRYWLWYPICGKLFGSQVIYYGCHFCLCIITAIVPEPLLSGSLMIPSPFSVCGLVLYARAPHTESNCRLNEKLTYI